MSASGRAVIDALLEILAVEREAIRILDGAGVERTAASKVALATRLCALAPAELEEEGPRLAVLRAELRRNGMLLAHARSLLKEAIALAGHDRILDARL